jgi:valyl-tRNA synthetase
VPFGDVYINPTVLNLEGKRMSKSLGTGIDPLALVERYGADSLRFALINRCTGEQDLRFAEKMVEDTRNFANKIWNAARFVRLALGDTPGPAAEPGDADTLPGRWILSRLARTASAVTAAFERFEFREACQSLYGFIWSEFCDWYLEMVKEDLRGALSPAGAGVVRGQLAWVLSRTMVLLHPIMPSLTEEIWQALPHEGETIMRAPWPTGLDRWVDPSAEAAMAQVMGLVRAIRSMRADLGIPSGDQVPVTVRVSEDVRPSIEQAVRHIVPLVRAASLRVAPPHDADGVATGAVSMIWGPAEIVLPVESEAARHAVRERLRKQLGSLEHDIARLGERLSSPAFLDNAPAGVVEADRAREQEFAARRKILQRYLADLGAP